MLAIIYYSSRINKLCEFESILIVQCNFRRQYGSEPLTTKTIRNRLNSFKENADYSVLTEKSPGRPRTS